MKRVSQIAFAILASIAFAGSASATQAVIGMQVICAPELGVFRLQTFAAAPTEKWIKADDATRGKYGLFWGYGDHECELGEKKVKFRKVAKNPNEFEFIVSINGDELFRFADVYGDENERFSPNHEIHIDDLYARHCWYADGVEQKIGERSWSVTPKGVSECEFEILQRRNR